MDKLKLIETGKHYFNDKNVELMYATSDGHWFHSHAQRAAMNHIGGKNLDIIEVHRSDVFCKTLNIEKKTKPQKQVSVESIKITESTPEPIEKTASKPKFKPNKGDKNGKK